MDSVVNVSRFFDGQRLRQARELKRLTKVELASRVGVSAAAVSQYESGMSPRPDILVRLSQEFSLPIEFFRLGRPKNELKPGDLYLRSLRSTTARDRARAAAFTEQVAELTMAVERHVVFPDLVLPEAEDLDPHTAAAELREAWAVGPGPVSHLVRLIESKGIVVIFSTLGNDQVTSTIDAFSTAQTLRPVIVLTPDRADDVYRHRFTAAHELGHLVMHADEVQRDGSIEKEADRFAAEFLMPTDEVQDDLPGRLDWKQLNSLSHKWGVSMASLVYRSRELGQISEATARRGFAYLNSIKPPAPPARDFPGELPQMLTQASQLATEVGATRESIARDLGWPTDRITELLRVPDARPRLRLV